MATAAKPFNTRSRRFRPGDPVSPSDELAPHSFDDLAERGFVATNVTSAAREPRAETAARQPRRKT